MSHDDSLSETASQTAGPYLHIGLAQNAAGIAVEDIFGPVMIDERTLGERIRIEGTVIDGTGAAVRDAMIELWQANAAGRYDHPADAGPAPLDPHFRGFGRAVTDFETGLYAFETIKPGPVRGRAGRMQAPHVNLAVFARGINFHLNTRIYFPDEPVANARDPLLNAIEQTARRDTLIARRPEGKDAVGHILYRFDIVLQGHGETVFLDL